MLVWKAEAGRHICLGLKPIWPIQQVSSQLLLYRDPVPLSPPNNELISLMEEISRLNNVEVETQLLLTNIYSDLRQKRASGQKNTK